MLSVLVYIACSLTRAALHADATLEPYWQLLPRQALNRSLATLPRVALCETMHAAGSAQAASCPAPASAADVSAQVNGLHMGP